MTRPHQPVVGMIGGGQLSRMTAAPAAALGIDFRVLAASPDESAAQVVRDPFIGSHDDLDDLRAFAQDCDVVTFDHEHVPPAYLEQLTSTAVRPGPSALIHAQDKITMRTALAGLGLPMPEWSVVTSTDEVVEFGERVGWPVIVKVSRGGYDGRGVWRVSTAAEATAVLEQPLNPGARWFVEAMVPFKRELSAQVARSPHGQAVAYPVVRTKQIDGICAEVVAPCPDLDDDAAMRAQEIALTVARELNVTGMLAVELFDTGSDILINELAMRPHNSGHWSIEGATTSQFENHLRAVLDWPLGSPAARAPFAVMVNILGADLPDLHTAFRHVMARDPGLHVHLYGKEVRPGRKVGHVTVLGDNVADLQARAWHAADYISGRIDGEDDA
jgi:5-(carboxyamino)imidazole ribonucleotide synthase